MHLAPRTTRFGQGAAPWLAILLSTASWLPLAGCALDPQFIGRKHEVPSSAEHEVPSSNGGDDGFGGDHFPGPGGGNLDDPPGGRPDCTPRLEGVVRDFKAFGTEGGHPDFERFEGDGLAGIVEEELGPDRKPVYAHDGPTLYTTGREYFDQWFRDVPGVNRSIRHVIPLDVSDQAFRIFYSDEFFPIDGEGWGNQDRDHNYGFTFELHMTFEYRGGDDFMFGGDDDIWVFINNRLAIDIGGVHGAVFMILDLDEMAEEYGLELGKQYPLDIFFAERRSGGSSLLISTLKYTNCEPIIL